MTRRLQTAGFATVLLLGGALPVRADVLVLESNIAAYPRGATLADALEIDVRPGRRLTVLRPAGETQDIVGPRKVKIGDLTRGERLDESLWRQTKALLEKQGPGSGYGAGATRGATR